MKLNDVRPSVETSGSFEEQFFSIQDQGMIFDILRNKMYSNPILAICREITCNARDAHREVGKADVPIVVKIPNNLEQFYQVKDFGPGISPERMSNIFIKYTASTKRDDNIQTGGFGLGAKTPFSYSDTFTIKTIYNGKEYNYACFIDETKVGKLVLLSEVNTDESNGTEIIVPVKPQDFRFFNEWTVHSTKHWDVRPILRGGSMAWPDLKKIISGNNWAMVPSENYNNGIKAIVDGIEYSLDMNAYKTYADTKIISSLKGNLILYFGVGELSLSASREQIYLDKPTQEKIKNKLATVLAEIKNNVIAELDKLDNLYAAYVFVHHNLNQLFHSVVFLGPLNWKGTPLSNPHISTKCDVYTFTKGKYSRKTGTDPNKLSRSLSHYIPFDVNTELVINDLGIKAPTPKHVKAFFENDLSVKKVHVICANSLATVESMNKDFGLDKMAPKLLSSVTKATGRSYTAATSRLLLFKFDKKISTFKQVSYSSLEEDNNEKVLCTFIKESNSNGPNRSVIFQNKNVMIPESISSVVNSFPQVSFYGIDETVPEDRVEEEFSDFMDIEDFIAEKVLKNTNINYVELKFAKAHNYDIDEELLKHHDKYQKLITDPNSIFIKRLELHRKIKEINKNGTGLLHLYEAVNGTITPLQVNTFIKDNPSIDISTINKNHFKKYPLLEVINSYHYNDNLIKNVSEYVNLIDKA